MGAPCARGHARDRVHRGGGGLLTEAAAHFAGGGSAAARLASAAGSVSRVLGPIGAIAQVASAWYEVIHTFQLEIRREDQQGFVYGLMWEALDEPDQLPTFNNGLAYTPEQHREAFLEGVRRGRAKATEHRFATGSS